MKTLSESIREALDAINSTMNQPVNEAPVKYHMTLLIDNPAPIPDDDDEEWDDEIEVGITYNLVGNYAPPTMIDPPEYPAVEDLHVYDLKTGEEITKKLPHDTISYIEDQIFDEDNAERSNHGVSSRWGRWGRP